MKRSMMQSLRKALIGGVFALMLAPLAHAEDGTHTVTVSQEALRGGTVFVMETVLYNVATGQRTVISQECEASNDPVPALNCIQVNPDPAGMQIFVKTITPPKS